MTQGLRHNRPRALVTGGGGFLGQAIIRELVKKDIAVTSLARRFYPDLAALDVRQIQGDIQDPDVVATACKGMDVVFHNAAKAGVWGPFDEYFQTNVKGTENIISACRTHGVSRLVYTSSASVIYDGTDMEGVDETFPYPDRYFTHYPKTKAIAEQMVVKAGKSDLSTIVLRPHLIWGPGDNHLVPRIIERAARLRIVGSGNNIADTIYIDNAAAAHILADKKLAQNPALSGRIYFISQGDNVPVWEMINKILAAAGKPPIQRKIPAAAAYTAGMVLEGIYRLFGITSEPMMTRFVARELSTSHWYDISAARKDLGFEPSVSTDEGLKHLARWLKSASD